MNKHCKKINTKKFLNNFSTLKIIIVCHKIRNSY